jgi:hypothetical protein
MPAIGQAFRTNEFNSRAKREESLLRLGHLQFFKAAGDQHSDVLSGKRFVHMYSSHSWAVRCQAAVPREVIFLQITTKQRPHRGGRISVKSNTKMEPQQFGG